MQQLKKQIETLKAEVNQAKESLGFLELESSLAVLDEKLGKPEIWNNLDYAQGLSKKAASLRQTIQPWQILSVQIDDILELMELGGDDLLPEFTSQVKTMQKEFESRKIDLLFSGKYDNREAVVRISAGVGGLDAQDFAAMLE